MLTRIWLVIGSSGSHSDYAEWNIAAYPEQDVAELHRKNAQDYYDACHKEYFGDDTNLDHSGFTQKVESNPFDLDASYIYDGINYTVKSVPMYLHPHQYQ